MAHYVTCSICKKRFDRDKYPSTLISPRRYAHSLCAGNLTKEEEQNERDRQALENYIIQLFGLEHMDGRITLQIQKYMQDHPDYTYSGMRRSLQYFYEVKGNSIEKAQALGNTIGIIPWIYDQAKQYYYNQWLLSQKNADKDVQSYVPKVREIVIPPPKREPRKRRIFMFLDTEEAESSGE